MGRIIICDNDERTVSGLAGMIERLFPGEFEIDGYVSFRQLMYEMGDELMEIPELLFLELAADDAEGIEAARLLQQRMPELNIIFITDHPECAEEIFDGIHPFGLLLKPFNIKRLEKYIRTRITDNQCGDKQIKIKKKGRCCYIPMSEVLYVESHGRQLFLHKKNGTECAYEKISDFCAQHPAEFFRCHKSYAVNGKQIREVSSAYITLKSGVAVPISRQKYQEARVRMF